VVNWHDLIFPSLPLTLSEAPKVLKPVSVDAAPNVCLGMVDNLMNVLGFQAYARPETIGEDFTAREMQRRSPVERLLKGG